MHLTLSVVFSRKLRRGSSALKGKSHQACKGICVFHTRESLQVVSSYFTLSNVTFGPKQVTATQNRILYTRQLAVTLIVT